MSQPQFPSRVLIWLIVPNRNSISRNGSRRFRTRAQPGQVMTFRSDNFPRQFDATIKFNHKFRFQSNLANQMITISRGALLNMLVTGITATSIARNIAAIKLNKVTIYGLASSTAGTSLGHNTVSVEWLSDLGTTVIKSDTGNAFDPPKVETGPPLNSRASFWSRTGSSESENLLKVSLGDQAIIDFDTSVVLYNDDSPAFVTTTGVSAGQMYVPKIGSNLIPVSYITI